MSTPVNQDSTLEHNRLIQTVEQGRAGFAVDASPGAICIGLEVLLHVGKCEWGHRFLLWGYMLAEVPLSKVALDRVVIVNGMTGQGHVIAVLLDMGSWLPYAARPGVGLPAPRDRARVKQVSQHAV